MNSGIGKHHPQTCWKKTIARLCTGIVVDNPFLEEATKQLQMAFPGLLSGFWKKWEPNPASQKQPIDVLALGAFMEACADLDFAVLHEFDMGSDWNGN